MKRHAGFAGHAVQQCRVIPEVKVSEERLSWKVCGDTLFRFKVCAESISDFS